MEITQINPYIRDAEIQNAIIEGEKERYAYDHRMFYVLENEGEIVIEGQQYKIKPDTVIFIPPAVGYRFCGKLKVAILNFDMTRAADTRTTAICPPVKELFSSHLLFDETLLDDLKTYRIVSNGVFLKNGLLDILRIWPEETHISDAETSAILKELLVNLIKQDDHCVDERAELCSKIQCYIRLNAEKRINNSVIAKHFGYHHVYLGEIFKQRTGITVYQFIIKEKMRLAMRWLKETDVAVEEIAFELGFSSRSHFCTLFKAYTGVTPMRYRRGKDADKNMQR